MSEFGKDINVLSRKGVFVPGISVEMFRNASLECVEDLLASGAMEDISLPSSDRPQGEWKLSEFQNDADVANGNYAFICTNCEHTDIHALTQRVPYCWWCGAQMKGTDNES